MKSRRNSQSMRKNRRTLKMRKYKKRRGGARCLKCPYCSSTDTFLLNGVGPCKCDECKRTFDSV